MKLEVLKVYHNWLDRWDEQRAQRGESGKEKTSFILDPARAFPDENIESPRGLCDRAVQASAEPAFFEEKGRGDDRFELAGDWIKFPSDIITDVVENNVVSAKITKSGTLDKALVIFHHWNARTRSPQIANFLSRRGVTVVEIAMPYHFERRRPGSLHADYMLSANIGRTIEAMRQAVIDGRKLIRWLKGQGYLEISVLGMSLGSWVAGLVAAHDASVSRASLFLPGGSLADMVWTGRATRSIRTSIQQEMELADLRRAWGPFNLEDYAHRLARPGLDIQLVVAKRDTVVMSGVTERLVQSLEEAGGRPRILTLNCGHYSLGKLPYILIAGMSLKRFLS